MGGAIIGLSNQESEYKLYYGLLHAHTLISNGSGTPDEAFQSAKNAGLDFFAITPHNHSRPELGARAERKDGVLIATNHDLYNGTSSTSLSKNWKENGHNKQEQV